MLEYSESNRQQLIVRQSSMDRAVEILTARGVIQDPTKTSADLVKAVKAWTDTLEKIIRTDDKDVHPVQ